MAPIRVIIADDHPIVLDGLLHLFAEQSDVEIVERCVTGEEALLAARRKVADVIVLDVRMPRVGGLEVLRALSEDKNAPRVVLFTAHMTDAELLDAVQLGVAGVVLKEAPSGTLLQCVRAVTAGGRWLDQAAIEAALERTVRRAAGTEKAMKILTKRELDIVRMVATGARNKEIAEKLGISEGTVKMHLHTTYEKLGISGRLELSIYARDHALI
jgi:DNA-binding NarL/FixJ family response regulator